MAGWYCASATGVGRDRPAATIARSDWIGSTPGASDGRTRSSRRGSPGPPLCRAGAGCKPRGTRRKNPPRGAAGFRMVGLAGLRTCDLPSPRRTRYQSCAIARLAWCYSALRGRARRSAKIAHGRAAGHRRSGEMSPRARAARSAASKRARASGAGRPGDTAQLCSAARATGPGATDADRVIRIDPGGAGRRRRDWWRVAPWRRCGAGSGTAYGPGRATRSSSGGRRLSRSVEELDVGASRPRRRIVRRGAVGRTRAGVGRAAAAGPGAGDCRSAAQAKGGIGFGAGRGVGAAGGRDVVAGGGSAVGPGSGRVPVDVDGHPAEAAGSVPAPILPGRRCASIGVGARAHQRRAERRHLRVFHALIRSPARP